MRSPEVLALLQDTGMEVSYRKLDYWIRVGLLSPRRSRGAREFTASDVETVYAIAQMYALGATREHVAAAAREIRRHPVSTRHHEVLVVSQDLTVVLRVTPAQLHQTPEGRFFKPCWVVPLRSFSGV